MKVRVTALLLVVAALTAAGITYATTAPSGLPRQDVVFGGGKFDFPDPAAPIRVRNFGLTARRDGKRGEGTLQYLRFLVEVTCVRIDGNAAVIGGIERSFAGQAVDPVPAAMYLVDNGPPVGDNVGGDTVSPLMLFGPDEDHGGLPKTCPAADASQATQLLYAGDITVHAGK